MNSASLVRAGVMAGVLGLGIWAEFGAVTALLLERRSAVRAAPVSVCARKVQRLGSQGLSSSQGDDVQIEELTGFF